MRFRRIVLPALAVALAGCQMTGNIQPHTPTTPAATGTPLPAAATASAENTPPPWAAARAHGMAFWASGSTPDWNVQVQKSRHPTLFVVLADSQRRLQIPDTTVASDPAKGSVTFRGSAKDGTPVELVIHRGQCRDDMRGQKLAASAELDIGASQYKGCGRFLMH